MTFRNLTPGARRRQRGAGIVETMVGILIGLVVVLVVYNLLAAAEGYRRLTTGASDAQVTGLLAQFMASRDAGNGGNGLGLDTPTLRGLITCTDPNLRPIPVTITAGGAADVSDSFVVMHSGSSRVLWPVPLLEPGYTNPGDTFTIQSPNGFSGPAGAALPTAAKPFFAVIVNGTGGCQLVKVTGATAPIVGGLGKVDLTFDASTVPVGPLVGGGETPATVINLGPQGVATRTRYEAYNSSANANCTALNAQGCQLVTTDLLTAGAARNPVAQNIVLMKAQYGIDTNNDQIVDCWTNADNSNTCADGRDYSATALRDPAVFPNLVDLNRILAVRVGVVVRSDEPDLQDATLVAASRAPTYLFNCAANTNAGCPGRILVPTGAPGALGNPNCNPGIICDGWRYRTYEMVIPLRNSIFNATL